MTPQQYINNRQQYKIQGDLQRDFDQFIVENVDKYEKSVAHSTCVELSKKNGWYVPTEFVTIRKAIDEGIGLITEQKPPKQSKEEKEASTEEKIRGYTILLKYAKTEEEKQLFKDIIRGYEIILKRSKR